MSDQEEEEKEEGSFLCTIAVTGTNARYQSIFVCRDCAPSENGGEMQCVCEGCVEACHENHHVEYIGMGPCYCDCGSSNNSNCKIQDKSRNKALEMKCADCFNNNKAATTPMQVFDARTFRCKQLESQETCERLITQIKTLVGHSRATFWIDASVSPDDLCELEQLALHVFQRHTSTLPLLENNNNNNNMVGAEWWVQFKDVTTTTSPEEKKNAAVDLHYDKDEDLADAFGLGYFPLLSTVTYLTEQSYPTLVFPHSYDDPEDEDMASMLVSHPRRGKHLVFDGRLLHGVPANPALLQQTTLEPPSGTRVTFLVNLWQGTKPSGIHVLEESIRDAIKSSVVASENEAPLVVDMQETTIQALELKSEDDLPEESRHRLELPFVSKGATWVDDDDDDSPNLVVLTFPAPRHESDTVSVRFENGLQAYLDYQTTDADDEDGEVSGPYEEDYV